MSSLSDLLNSLEEGDEEKIINNLSVAASQYSDVELENRNILLRLIKFENGKIIHQFVEVAAEWAKLEHNRSFFTEKSIITYFLGLLEFSTVDESLVVGAIRVLGNICYENEEARSIINKNGLARVIAILNDDKNRKNNLLTLKASGFLVNLLISAEELQKDALNLNIIEVVEGLFRKYIKLFNENQMLFAFLLTVLNNVIDFIDEQNILFTDDFCCLIVDIFKLSQTPEISVLCLEILHGQADKEEVKTLLANNGVCELVFDLIEKYRNQVNDDETRSVMKMACDMIVIILTGDECMYLLYDKGKGKVYENMVTWLDSDDPDLLSTGVLAVGNFARKDTHCIQMVQHGISKKLIKLLSKYNASNSEIKVQHALLSTLKNLVIPPPNKCIILEEGLIDAIYPMINIEQHFVIFKLLGTFRMVVDGQEKTALDLISRREFLEKLVYWCYNTDHLGIRGEIPRLLAWLIKNCHSFKPFGHLLKVKDVVKCLVEMISSNHGVMQNEAFYSLNLLCIWCTSNDNSNNEINQTFYEQLINADIGKNLNFAINKYNDKMDKQTIENLITLLENLIQHRLLIEHFTTNNFKDGLEKLKNNSNAQSVLERLNVILCAIN